MKYEILKEEVGHKKLMKALQTEILARKDQSKIRGKNEMSYFKNSLTYLHNRAFEPYLNLDYKVKSRQVEERNEMIKTENLF